MPREDFRAYLLQRGFRTKGIAMQQHPGNENQFAVAKSSGGDGTDAVERALSGEDPQRVGWFRFYSMTIAGSGRPSREDARLLAWLGHPNHRDDPGPQTPRRRAD